MSMYDNNAILNMWAKGIPAAKIAARYGMNPAYARAIARRARLAGDLRATKRREAAGTSLTPILDAEAERRGMSSGRLRSAIVRSVCKSDLFRAVLDD